MDAAESVCDSAGKGDGWGGGGGNKNGGGGGDERG